MNIANLTKLESDESVWHLDVDGLRITVTTDELMDQRMFRKKVLEMKPGLIGFSVLEITYDQGLELAKAIEDLDIPVIFGGIYPTFAPRIVFSL